MDIQTKDGILLRNIPDGTPDDVIKARIEKIRAESQPRDPSYLEQAGTNLANFYTKDAPQIAMGALKGASDIGATLLYPVDKITDMVKGDRAQSPGRNQERRQSLNAFFQERADPSSMAFKGGDLAAGIAGTAGVGGGVAKPVQMAGKAIPSIAPYAQKLAAALQSGGFTLNAPKAATVKEAIVNGATRLAGGAATAGAAAGLINPEDAATGAAFGAAIPGGAKVVGGAARMLGKAASPLYKKGQERILADLLLNKTGDKSDDVIAALKNARGNTPGFNPTVGQSADNADLATMERVFRERNPGLFDDVGKSQNTALAASINGIGGDDIARQTLDQNRSGAADALYGKAMTSDAQRFEEAVKMANQQRNLNQGGMMLGGNAADVTTPGLRKLSQAPAMQDAIKSAQTLYANKNPGATLSDPLGSLEGLHYIKLAIDNQLNGGSQATALASHGNAALNSIKQNLLKEIETISPMYGNARKTFTDMSQPINQLDVGNAIRDKYIPALYRDLEAPPELRHAELAKILNDNGDKLAQNVTGFKGATLDKTLRPEQLQAIKNAGKDAQYIKQGQLRGRPVNSSTFQNLAFNSEMESSVLPELLRNFAPASVTANTLKAGRDMLYKGSNEKLAQQLAELLQDPQATAALMKGRKGIPKNMLIELLRPELAPLSGAIIAQ